MVKRRVFVFVYAGGGLCDRASRQGGQRRSKEWLRICATARTPRPPEPGTVSDSSGNKTTKPPLKKKILTSEKRTQRK